MVGDVKYRDVNGDGIINTEDKVMISEYGNMPRIQYGLGMNIDYKGFNFGVFFNGSAMRTLMISGITPFGQDDYNVMQFIANDYWTEANPNPNAAYPRLGLTDAQTANNTQPSTYWMRNGNFIRFKTLEIGYRFSMPACTSAGTTCSYSARSNYGIPNWHGTVILYRERLISDYS